MSDKRPSRLAALHTRASVFAALGDVTRLSMLARLSGGEPQSTRQAVTKHLRVLESAGVVRSARIGRESRFALDPQPIEDLRQYLDEVSRQWDDALVRLKAHVET
jgi:DNA-binding transcriptional ArsR family regulator